MKNAISLLSGISRSAFILVITAVSYSASYGQNCDRPLNDATFKQLTLNLASNRSGRNQYNTAYGIVHYRCLTSLQVKTLAQYLDSENLRLRLCLEAYAHVYDPENFYEVYDAFSTFSMAFRLHDMIHGIIPVKLLPEDSWTPVRNPSNPVISFPDLAYPVVSSYSGITGCVNPVDDQLFINIAYRLMEEQSDDDKLNYLSGRAQVDCFTMAQSMKLSTLFENEIGALAMMKATFTHLYDMGNYQAAAILFRNELNRNDWLNYAEYVLSETDPVVEEVLECEPSSKQLAQINSSIKSKNFPKEKLDLARLLVKDYCFSVDQIKGLMNQFTFSSDKLELVKITYNNCTDPENYYLLIDTMTFPSEKEELRKYIEANRK